MLEYLDAFLIGLTATPSTQTFGFFNQNLVMEYNHREAVADGINVDYDVYRIETEITAQGATIEAGSSVDRRDRRTCKVRWEELEEDLTYTAGSSTATWWRWTRSAQSYRRSATALFLRHFPAASTCP